MLIDRALHFIGNWWRTLGLVLLTAGLITSAVFWGDFSDGGNGPGSLAVAVVGIFGALFSIIGAAWACAVELDGREPYTPLYQEAFTYARGDKLFVAVRGGGLREPSVIGPSNAHRRDHYGRSLGLHHEGFDPDDADGITDALVRARTEAEEYNARVRAAHRLARTLS